MGMQRRLFCILSSVLACDCQGNSTAEISSGRVYRSNHCAFLHLPCHTAAGHRALLDSVQLHSLVFKMGFRNYSVPKQKPGKTMGLLNVFISKSLRHIWKQSIQGEEVGRKTWWSLLVDFGRDIML